MSSLRRIAINAFILSYLGVYALAILIRREAWPICSYPMFASAEKWRDLVQTEYFVVQGNREVRLNGGRHSIAEMGLEYSLPHFAEGNDLRSENAKKALGVILEGLVGQWKSDGRHAGEPTALKVYQVSYHFPRSGDPAPHVTRKILLLEADRAAP
jgi:hypothetical protein